MNYSDDELLVLVAAARRLVNLDGVVDFGELRGLRALRQALGSERWSELAARAGQAHLDEATLLAAWWSLSEPARADFGARLSALMTGDGGPQERAMLIALGVIADALELPEPSEPRGELEGAFASLRALLQSGELPDTQRVQWRDPAGWGDGERPAVAQLSLRDGDRAEVLALDNETLQVELLPGAWPLEVAPRELNELATRFASQGTFAGTILGLYLGVWPEPEALAEQLAASPWIRAPEGPTLPPRQRRSFRSRFSGRPLQLWIASDVTTTGGRPVVVLIDSTPDPWSERAIANYNEAHGASLPLQAPVDALAALPLKRAHGLGVLRERLEEVTPAANYRAVIADAWAYGMLRNARQSAMGLLGLVATHSPATRCAAHALLLRRDPQLARSVQADEDDPEALAIMAQNSERA